MTAAASLAVLVVIAAAIGIVVVARILGLSPARHAGAIAALVVVGLVAGLGLPALLNESTNGRISPGESWPWIVLGWLAIASVTLRRLAAGDRAGDANGVSPAAAARAVERNFSARRSAEPQPKELARPGPAQAQGQGQGQAPAADRSPPMQLFISYRRSDSQDVAGRLYDRLSRHFGGEHVFKDVDSIPLGVDFRRYVGDQVGRCDALLAIIGPGWLDAENDQGRRLDDPRDMVRVEVAAALKRDIPVVPILIGNASLPDEHALPDELRELGYRNGIPLRPDPDFHSDVDRLIEGLEASRRRH